MRPNAPIVGAAIRPTPKSADIIPLMIMADRPLHDRADAASAVRVIDGALTTSATLRKISHPPRTRNSNKAKILGCESATNPARTFTAAL